MNYGRTVSPGGISIQPYMSYGLGQLRIIGSGPSTLVAPRQIALASSCRAVLSQDVGNHDIQKMGSYLFKNADSSTTTETETNETKVHNSKERVSDKIDLNTLKADKKAKKAFWSYIPPKKLL